MQFTFERLIFSLVYYSNRLLDVDVSNLKPARAHCSAAVRDMTQGGIQGP